MMISTEQGNTKATGAVTLGFIGLGYMGSRIAKRLIDAGHRVVVYNRDRKKAEALVSQGAEMADSPGDLATVADIILSCLADARAVRNVYLSTGGVLDRAKSGAVIVEMSTVEPETAFELAAAAREFGIPVLDVAISGSTVAAENGTLTLFGGGDPETFEAVAPLFPAIAKQWLYMGKSGRGVAMKLVVNTLLGVGMQAMAEALALGRALGIDRGLLFDTLAKTAVVAPALLGKLASAKKHDYSPQFPARLMYKDFLLIKAKANSLGVYMPATAEATKMMGDEMSSHASDEDFSAVIRALELLASNEAA